jgi:hypothetical protein
VRDYVVRSHEADHPGDQVCSATVGRASSEYSTIAVETDERTGEHQERRKERDSQRESARLDESDENPVAERDTDERGQKPRQA